jgi:hypothetical protein
VLRMGSSSYFISDTRRVNLVIVLCCVIYMIIYENLDMYESLYMDVYKTQSTF